MFYLWRKQLLWDAVPATVWPVPSGISTPKKEIVVVSGSSGLRGSALIKKLAGKYQIIGLDNAGYPYPPPEAACVTIDITSDEDVKKVFDDIRAKRVNRIVSFVHLVVPGIMKCHYLRCSDGGSWHSIFAD